MLKSKTILNTTTSNQAYKSALKFQRRLNREIWCERCPYHRIENAVNGKQDAWRQNRAWKSLRKKQYRESIKYERYSRRRVKKGIRYRIGDWSSGNFIW